MSDFNGELPSQRGRPVDLRHGKMMEHQVKTCWDDWQHAAGAQASLARGLRLFLCAGPPANLLEG